MSEAIDFNDLQQRHEQLLADYAHLKKAYEKLLFEFEKLRRRLVGPTKEQVSTEQDAQLSLLAVVAAMGRLEAGDLEAAGDVEDALLRAKDLCSRDDKKANKGKPHGRRNVSLEDLPVERIVIDPPERSAPGGERFVKIGEEVSEHVEHRAASLVRVQWVRPIFVDPGAPTSAANDDASMPPAPASQKQSPVAAEAAPAIAVAHVPAPAKATGSTAGESALEYGAPLCAAARPSRRPRLYVAELPDRPVPRCLAGPGLLAHVLVSKFADHLPLHRQERIFKRQGFTVVRSTLWDWVDASTNLLGHIVDAMWQDVRDNASYCIVDATGVLVQAKNRCGRCHFYIVVVPKEHVLYRFTATNKGEDVARVLQGISGHVHADAASVYHELYRQADDVIEVGCWAHARRKFFEALSRDRERAMIGIGFISLLYDAHRDALDVTTGIADREQRAGAARPILARIFRWARKELRGVEQNTPIHLALGYLCRQRRALTRFLKDGRLRLDTNPAELGLRREVVGRRNWVFCGSDHGAVANTIAVSLIASCELHGIEPWAYLRDVLLLLPGWSQLRVLELSPKHWRATAARPGVSERLAMLHALYACTPPADATMPAVG